MVGARLAREKRNELTGLLAAHFTRREPPDRRVSAPGRVATRRRRERSGLIFNGGTARSQRQVHASPGPGGRGVNAGALDECYLDPLTAAVLSGWTVPPGA